jgi:hypothetical protein
VLSVFNTIGSIYGVQVATFNPMTSRATSAANEAITKYYWYSIFSY